MGVYGERIILAMLLGLPNKKGRVLGEATCLSKEGI